MTARSAATLQPDYRKRAEAGLGLGRDSPIIDLLMVVVPIGALLFNLIIGPLTPILVMATVGAYALFRYERLVNVLGSTWPLLLLPLFCLASVAWSEAPAATVRYGILYLITVLTAILIGAGTSRISVLKGLQVVFSTYLTLSLFLGRWTNWGDGSYAFAGLAGSKNAAGDAAAIGLLISATTLFWAIGQRKPVWALIAILTIPGALYSLVFAKSTGALAAAGLALACLLLWLVSRRLALTIRTILFGITMLGTIVVLATTPIWVDLVFDSILTASGKDSKLTGRADLWQVADRLIAQKPILGLGYNAFWVQGNLDAERLWKLLQVPSGSPFNFHNTARDLLVNIGFAGLVLYAVVWLAASIRLLWRTMLVPDYFGIFCSAMLVFVAPRAYFELVGFSNMHFPTMILLNSVACGFRPHRLNAVMAS
jgi:exopolysaccharide production protein ExoQ